jgi:hypothetical protein
VLVLDKYTINIFLEDIDWAFEQPDEIHAAIISDRKIMFFIS